MKITEKLVINHYKKYTSHSMMIPNTKFFKDFESDIICITSDMSYEYEIKLSTTDYINDFKNKSRKHNLYVSEYKDSPNYFYFITPKGLIGKEMIPDKYGLVEFTVEYKKFGSKSIPYLSFCSVKNAKRLHNNTLTIHQYKKLLSSVCWKLFK